MGRKEALMACEFQYIFENDNGISTGELRRALAESLEGRNLKKVLILPPDFTRMYSGAGKITEIYYDLLKDTCQVDIMPALGTHAPMTREEWAKYPPPSCPRCPRVWLITALMWKSTAI